MSTRVTCIHWLMFIHRDIFEHYYDVIIGAIASQITSLTTVYSTAVYSDADQSKHQSSASLAFVREIHRNRWISHAQMASNAENVSIWWRHHEEYLLNSVTTLCLLPSHCLNQWRKFWHSSDIILANSLVRSTTTNQPHSFTVIPVKVMSHHIAKHLLAIGSRTPPQLASHNNTLFGGT